jgi:hypothetical protein
MSQQPPRRISVVIDELVLHGLPLAPAHHGRLLQAVQDELAVQLQAAHQGVDHALPRSGANEHSLDAGAITYDPNVPVDPDSLGRAIARAVHGGLISWPR